MTKKEIMTRAWEIKKQDSNNIFSLCLKCAWAEAKVSSRIAELEEKGFRRWQKGNFDRLYINAVKLGLECDYYKTGNIRSACFNGEGISNSRARRMSMEKTYIDVKTGRVYSTNDELKLQAAILAGVAA